MVWKDLKRGESDFSFFRLLWISFDSGLKKFGEEKSSFCRLNEDRNI